jgi:hypothetical protein
MLHVVSSSAQQRCQEDIHILITVEADLSRVNPPAPADRPPNLRRNSEQ